MPSSRRRGLRLAAVLFSLLLNPRRALPRDPALAGPGRSAAVLSEGPAPKSSYLASPAVKNWIERGHREYYAGRLDDALADYRRALQEAPSAVEAWLNGGAVWEEHGNPANAAEWLSRAARLAPRDPKVLTDLGWAEFHHRDWGAAEKQFLAALAVDPRQTYALLGMGRVRLEQGRAREAAQYFDQAITQESPLTVAFFWKGQALERAGDLAGAAEAYRRAAEGDSSMLEARYALALTDLRRRRLPEATAQFSRILAADPDNGPVRRLLEKIESLGPPQAAQERRVWGSYAHKEEILMLRRGNIPTLRVGIGTSAMGKPLPRTGMDFVSLTPFQLLDAKTGRRIAWGEAREQWHAHLIPKRPSRPSHIDVLDPRGRRVLSTRRPFLIRPDIARGASLLLHELAYAPGFHGRPARERHLRGEIEVSLLPSKRAFKLVNIVDLESYVNGVLSAEMPIASPLEALKAQSVVARSHAIYLKTVSHLHRKDGYDLCDGQHCQVYLGVQAETERSRAVVEATRGRIAAYHGRVADVIYSSNCGGHTQSGSELNGWGDVPYWKGIADAPPGSPPYPHSPWELRWRLRSQPTAYCMPSSYVYPAHYRWTRVISAQEIEARINRKSKIGRILGILALRRAASGHVNSVRILGSRQNLAITDESRIRNLLAPGSQRSALFFIETEYGADRRPSAFVFHGGGWGHGVGMCQSGAAGRAEQGALYEDILRAYYPGIEIGNLRY